MSVFGNFLLPFNAPLFISCTSSLDNVLSQQDLNKRTNENFRHHDSHLVPLHDVCSELLCLHSLNTNSEWVVAFLNANLLSGHNVADQEMVVHINRIF